MASEGQKSNRRKNKGRNKRNKKKREEEEEEENEDIENYWRRWMEPMRVHDFRWKVIGYRGNLKKKYERAIVLDSMVSSITWEDAEIQTCSISVQAAFKGFPLLEGHKVTVLYSTMAQPKKWTKLFTLRVDEVSMNPKTKTAEIQASDELAWLKKSKDDFLYKKGKGRSRYKRPHGWKGHWIVRDICKRYGIQVGSLIKCRKTIKNFNEKNTTPLKAIEKIYEMERKETGYKYVIQMRRGRLWVTRLRRSRDLLVYGGTALDATITRKVAKEIGTEFSVTGKVKPPGKPKTKQEYTQKVSKRMRRRYGYIHQFLSLEDEERSWRAMGREAREQIRELNEPIREAEITVPGYPGLRRGDAVKANFPTEGFVELMYVKQASHSVSGSEYTTTLTLSLEEYYEDEEGEKIREKICKQAKKKGRKRPWYCYEKQQDKDIFMPYRKRPKRSRNRGNGHLKRKRRVRR